MIKVRQIKEGPFEVNEELAGLVPMATDVEQAVLTRDIADNEQRDPIVLWQGKVVDGRCRQKALVTLGKHILYKELDDNLTENEVRVFVKSVNTRRNLTMTQKVISACRESLLPGSKSVNKIAKSWGIGEGTLKNARYIAKERPEFIDPLFNGKTVTIENAEGKKIESNKITAIYAFLKRTEENVAENTDHAWVEDSYIKTQAGKEWYYRQLEEIGIIGEKKTKMLIAELANYKFMKENDSKIV